MNSPTLYDQKRKFWGKMIWISAIFLVLSICAGVASYIGELIYAHKTISFSDLANPSSLLVNSLHSEFAGLDATPFVLYFSACFIFALIWHRKFSDPTLKEHGL